MGTLSERILHGTAGEYVDRVVDRAYVHDGTGVLTLEAWKSMGERRLRTQHISTFSSIISSRPTTARRQRSSTSCVSSPAVRSCTFLISGVVSVTRS